MTLVKKRFKSYHSLRPDLREEIVAALDQIAENDFVEDIELERLIVGHHQHPHVRAEQHGKLIRASIYTMDRLGRGIGCIARVSYKYTGLNYITSGIIEGLRNIRPKTKKDDGENFYSASFA